MTPGRLDAPGGAGVRVSVPASSANIGPGFDVLAVALDLRSTFDAWLVPADTPVEASGEGAAAIEAGATNLVLRAMRAYFALAGNRARGVALSVHNNIPLARGLGSSAAAVVGGLVAARALCPSDVDDAALLDLAAEIEGHVDNASAALLGGCRVAARVDGRQVVREVPWPDGLGCVALIPDLELTTGEARAALPSGYPGEDVVHNLGRLALLLGALRDGRLEDLGAALDDRVHQPYRAPLVPGFTETVAAARGAGALGAYLSGAGPSVIALYDRARISHAPIANAMTSAARAAGLSGIAVPVEVSRDGARTAPLPPRDSALTDPVPARDAAVSGD